MAAADWDACLDALEAELDRVDPDVGGEPLADGKAPDWAPPTDLGPLPADRQPRAEALLRRVRRVAEGIEATRGELVGDLGRARTRRDAARTYAATGTG